MISLISIYHPNWTFSSDVVSLYPNLKWEAAGEEIYQAILDSDIVYEGNNWKEGVRYLALARGYFWCQTSNLKRILPWRRHAHGSWPGVTGAGPMGPSVNDEKQWEFPNVTLTEVEKKMVVGEVLRLAVEILFKTHMYSFRGSTFRQSDGGPIGLRATCAIARVVMGMHNKKWKKKMKDHNIQIEFEGFYVDDGRVVLYGLRAGWRWTGGGLWYCKEWEIEDKDILIIE